MSFGIFLDSSIDPMEETRILKKYWDIMEELQKKYPFDQIELRQLIILYHKLKDDPKAIGISRMNFVDLLHKGFDVTDDFIIDRIIGAIVRGTAYTTFVELEPFIKAMAIFIYGTLDEKIDFCFRAYNIMGDGVITRETMFMFLKTSIHCIDDDPEDQIKDLIEVLMKKMDLDRDGRVSYNDFMESVKKDPTLLECLGGVLPSRLRTYSFMNTIFRRLPDHC